MQPAIRRRPRPGSRPEPDPDLTEAFVRLWLGLPARHKPPTLRQYLRRPLRPAEQALVDRVETAVAAERRAALSGHSRGAGQ